MQRPYHFFTNIALLIPNLGNTSDFQKERSRREEWTLTSYTFRLAVTLFSL
jgi:hypothetical protein